MLTVRRPKLGRGSAPSPSILISLPSGPFPTYLVKQFHHLTSGSTLHTASTGHPDTHVAGLNRATLDLESLDLLVRSRPLAIVAALDIVLATLLFAYDPHSVRRHRELPTFFLLALGAAFGGSFLFVDSDIETTGKTEARSMKTETKLKGGRMTTDCPRVQLVRAWVGLWRLRWTSELKVTRKNSSSSFMTSN